MFDRHAAVSLLSSGLASLLLLSAAASAQHGVNLEPVSSSTVSRLELAVPRKAVTELERGVKACAKADWHSAVERFRKAIALYPQYALAYNNLGTAYTKAGDPQKGFEAYQQAVSRDDHLSMAYVNMARLLQSQDRLNEAEPLLEKVLSFDLRNGDALFVLSVVEFRLGKYDGAVAHAHEAMSINPQRYALAHYIAGQALQAQKSMSDAAAEYTLFLKQSPDSPYAAQVRAALRQLGNPTQ